MTDPSMSRPIIHQRSPHSFVNTFGFSASTVSWPFYSARWRLDYRFSTWYGTGSNDMVHNHPGGSVSRHETRDDKKTVHTAPALRGRDVEPRRGANDRDRCGVPRRQ